MPRCEGSARRCIRRVSPGTIEIRARVVADRLVVGVRDNGVGLRAGEVFAPAPPGRGIGLSNLRERLATLYGGDQLKGESDPLLEPTRDPARIRAFFVHPAWARRGLGRMLFNACEDAARRQGFVRLELMATLPGEPLYRALGFEAVEHLSLAMPDGVELPLIRMRRAIAGVDGTGATPVQA